MPKAFKCFEFASYFELQEAKTSNLINLLIIKVKQTLLIMLLCVLRENLGEIILSILISIFLNRVSKKNVKLCCSKCPIVLILKFLCFVFWNPSNEFTTFLCTMTKCTAINAIRFWCRYICKWREIRFCSIYPLLSLLSGWFLKHLLKLDPCTSWWPSLWSIEIFKCLLF